MGIRLFQGCRYSFDENVGQAAVRAQIRVNSIAPGIFPSGITAGDSDEPNKSNLQSEASFPAGRYCIKADMGQCAVFHHQEQARKSKLVIPYLFIKLHLEL